MTLPQAVSAYLVALSTQNRSLAYLQVSRAGELIGQGGELAKYNLQDIKLGDYIGDRLLFLEGFFPLLPQPESLPGLHTENGLIVDIHIIPEQGSGWIVLLDTTEETQKQQQLQQKSNELSLLQQQHAKVLKQCLAQSDTGKILSAINILSLEWQGDNSLKVIGEVPSWVNQAFEGLEQQSEDFSAASFSPFLDHFLTDARAFWQTRSSQFLRSGIWTEVCISGREINLEATALFLEERPIILIELSEMKVAEKFRWLQTARQDKLSFMAEQKSAANQIINATFYDTLTGLPNRSLFLSQLENFFEANRGAEKRRFAIVVLNLDRFQSLNNSLGSGVGDQVLIAVANRIRDSLRHRDIPVRFGLDEFGILLDNVTHTQDAAAIVQRLLDSINQPLLLGQQKIYFTASAGIAVNEVWYQSSRDILRDASLAMEQAKSLGKGRYVIFDREMRARAFELWSLESALHTAVEKEELLLCFQPIVDLKTNHIDCFEALIRWQHPSKGLIAPAKFIPLAEESGHIIEIDTWVLNTACQAIQQWQAATGKLTQININIAPQHFVNGSLFETVQMAIATSAVPPSALCLEITESFLLADTKVAIATLNQLRALGIKIAIDDFGTGYASLGYLQDLPLDKIKIDGYFIKMMQDNGPDIVSTIIELAHKLGFSVTAEWVETVEQYSLLKQLGCDTAQGHLFSKSIPMVSAQGLIDAEIIIPTKSTLSARRQYRL